MNDFAPRPNPSSNGLGVAGFIVSVVGLFTGGCVSPLGLLISFIALFKSPRGFAIAGVIVGLVGSIGLIIIGLLLGGAVLLIVAIGLAGAGTIFQAGGFDGIQTLHRFTVIVDEVRDHREYAGAFPDALPASLPADMIVDPWGTPIEYTLVAAGRGFALTSAGPDRLFATGDDYSITFDGNAVTIIVEGEERNIPALEQAFRRR